MLENKKNVRKVKIKNIILILMTIIMILGIYTPALAEETTIQSIDLGEDKAINPIYKPEWTKLESTLDTANKTLSVVVKGSAYKTKTVQVDEDETIETIYASDVTSTLEAEDIQVFINGAEVTDTTNPNVVVNSGVVSTNLTSGKKEVTHTIILSNLEKATRQAGIPYKEWSGNISLKIKGRGKDSGTYTEDVLTDEYGNQNMMETDQNGTNDDGTWIDITFEDTQKTDHNTDGIMFADFIHPEFTYKYSETVIGSGPTGDKKVIVAFDVTDKYFKETTLTANDITINLIDTDPATIIDPANITKTLTKTKEIVINESTGVITYQDAEYELQAGERKVGEKYELEITGLEQKDENGFSTGYTYSGPMSIGFPTGKITDKSGNINNAATITIGVDETDGNEEEGDSGTAQVVDVVDPVWEVVEDESAERGTIKLKAKDKYYATSSLNVNDVTIYVNNNIIDSIAKPTTAEAQEANKDKIWKEITGPEEIVAGQEYVYTLKLSNVTLENGEYEEFVPTNVEELVGDTAKYRKENGGTVEIEIASGTITDQSGNQNQSRRFEVGIMDDTKPEVYKVQVTKDKETGEETIVFNVTDRNYNPEDFVELNEISLLLDGVATDKINKKSLTHKEIRAEIDETIKVVGHQYTLVLDSFIDTDEEFDEEFNASGTRYREASGIVGMVVAENAAEDYNGNTLNTNTTTISEFVDFINPEITKVSSTNNANKTQTIVFTAIDKHFDTTNTLDEGEITVKVNGEIASSITKSLSSTPITATVNGVANTTVGYTYTLILSNFEETEKQTGKSFIEWSGNVSIEIAEGAVIDKGVNGDANGDITKANKNELTTINGEFADFIEPKIEKVSSTNNADKTQTIIFTATDKYFDTTDELEASEITVYIDGEIPGDTNKNGVIDGTETLAITKALSSEPITETVEGAERTVGYTYTLVLSNFENSRTSAVYGEYTDYSGSVSIKIAEGAVKDTTSNVNEETTINGEFADFIKPNITYKYAESAQGNPGDINYEGKTFTMIFEVTDKYFANSTLASELAAATTETEIQQVIEKYLTILIDSEAPDWTKVDKDLTKEEVKSTFNKTVDGTVVNGEYVIGYKYTLVLSNLEQLQILEGDQYLDYSGVITVAVKEEIATDTSTNSNDATTITSGIDIPGGSTTDKEIVDVVDPLWQKVSSSAYAFNPTDKTSSIATVTIRGTDKYYASSSLTNKIKVLVNGADVTDSVNVSVSGATPVYKVGTTDEQVGDEYTITITGFAQDANQVKIEIAEDAMLDQSGNGNKVTQMIAYNCLKLTSSETEADSAFLGNTSVERQNVENVTFVSSLSGMNTSTAWDVSAQQDGSIMAWYVDGDTAPYTVYIGSNDEIFANQNSRKLFRYIGYGTNCTATEAITNLNLLNVKSVTDMSNMFQYCGYRAMTSLTLPETFDTSNVKYMAAMFGDCGRMEMTSLTLPTAFNTSNVINMGYMFSQCGYTKMISLNLGSNFDTSQVTNMTNMFNECGHTAMTSLNLGTNFDTTKVTNMKYMFYNTGFTAMTSLDLGDKFDTSSVTNMYRMFMGCGYAKMTSLDLGDNFNTSSVTDMNKMFDSCGNKAMTSLDLGDLFYTTNVTDMYKMFNGCGATAMTSLDLGPAFTKIPSGAITKQASDYQSWELDQALEYNAYDSFATNCGKSGAVIYAPESIYKNITSFKTSSTDTTTASGTIATSTGRTIKPIYKPEWTKESSAYDETNKTLSVTVKGSAYKSQVINSKVIINYASDVTSTLDAEDITVFVNGVEVTSTVNPTVTVNAGTTSTNGTSGKTEITHTILLSNLEEAARRADLPYKELSGNIKIKIAGRGQETSTYTANVLKDQYGNQSMMETDETGTWIDVTYSDPNTDRNTTNTMFADFIKPEFTYLSSETTVDHNNKILTVVFSAVDKYFDAANSSLALSDFYRPGIDASSDGKAVFQVDGEIVDINVAGNNLTSEAVYDTDGTTRIGTKYTLVVKNLQKYQGNDNDAFSYSGIVSIGIPANKFQDLSGNKNDGTTITIGVDEKDGNPNTEVDSNGTIVDVVDPVWKVGDVDLDAGTIKLIAKDKYFAQCTINETAITVYANGIESTIIGKDISQTPTDIYDMVNGVNTIVGKEYTLQLSNITPSEAGYTTFIPTNLSTDQLNNTAGFKYRNENGGAISIKIASGTITDQSGNTSIEQTFDIGKIDATQPEVYDVQKIQDANANTDTFIFNVTDRNYDPSDLITTDEITVWVDGVQVNSIQKTSLTYKPIKLDIDGETGKVLGHQYTLLLSNIAEAVKQTGKSYLEWSGTVEIRIANDAAKDLKGNTLNPSTTTISDFVDYIKPEIEPVTVTNPIDTTNKTYTMSFNVIDKYLDTNNKVTANEITVYIDGEEATAILKPQTEEEQENNKDKIWIEISEEAIQTPTECNKTVDGTVTSGIQTIGQTYTLVLSNFEQSAKQAGKDFMEWSGTVKIEIDEDAVNDTKGNTLDADATKRTVNGEHVDFIKPVVEKVSSAKDADAKTETIVFKATDKYMDISDLVTEDELTIYVDGEIATGVTIESLTNTPITEVRSGTTYTIGHEYTLVLSNFEQALTGINRNREFTDWSGTVEVKVLAGAVKDIEVTNPNGEIAGGNLNDETTLTGDFVDFIKPNVTYEFAEADIVRNHLDKAARKYTMVIDITDKYFDNSIFETALENATTDAEKLAVLQQYLTICVDGVDVTNVDTVTKKIVGIDDVTATMNKTVDGVITTGGTHVIGKRFTLEISDLEQDMVEIGEEFLNYSGVITVAIKEDTVIDTTGNGNVGTTITSGVNMAGNVEFEADGTPVIVDLVDPLWEVAGTVTAKPFEQTATIPIKGTDKYIATNNLQASDITIIVTSPSGVVTVNGANAASEGMTLNITESAITYGKQYTIKLDGYTSDAYQVKITIRDGVLADESGNTSQETSFVLFSSLIETATEKNVNSGFLGNTSIERQKIEQVIFKDSLNGINATRWDVSQLQDGSIWAWYEPTDHGTYKVYIGSYIIMNGNVNSSYLFANIGRDANCAVTGDTTDNEIIENLHLLHVDGVQNMSHMFDGCGYTNMQSLDLGDYFDTSSARDMSYMFQNCGNTAMTTFDLGTKFDTTKVTNMSGMFQNFGQKLGSLTLGENFKTNAVTDMSNMFNGCGKSEMTTLNLGNNFDTSNVQDMSGMFQDFAQTKMTTLDLGNLFYTTSATDMSNMFNGCGTTSMTTLDLGPHFTRIADNNTGFATNLGNSGTTIYAPESIYSNMKNFKLNTTSSTTITLDGTTQGTINPVYKPEWTKVSSTLDKTAGEMTVIVNGSSNKVGTPVSQINYTSDVTHSLNANQINVYIDGELASDITTAVTGVTEITNETTGKKEVQYTITLSNFEEEVRQGGKNFKEWSGNVSLQFAKGSLKDMCGSEFDGDGNLVAIEGNSNLAVIDIAVDETGTTTKTQNIVAEEPAKRTANTTTTEAEMFADLIKPEFTYEYSNTTIDYDKNAKTVTVIFDVTDKYFSSTDLATDSNGSLITVKVDGDENANSAITKTLTKVEDLYYTVNGSNRKVGERYELVIGGLEQEPNNSFDYSGIVTLVFDSGITKDLSGNQNDGTTITIGVDDTDGNTQDTQDPNGVVVDVVDPIWRVENLNTTTTDGITKATMDLIATDKFFQESTLQKDDIQIKVAGVNIATTAPELQRTLSEPTYIKWDNETGTYTTDGITQENANGVKYTFTASNFEETYEAFFAERAKYAVDPATGRLYREYSGPIEIVIPEGKAIDQSGNTNREFTIDGIGHVDTLKPEVIKVSSTSQINSENVELSKHIVVFDIVDKYLDTSAITTTDTSKIHVYLDGEAADTVTKTITNIEQLRTKVGTDENHLVGYRYTLELSNFENPRTEIDYDREYTDWSGDLTIKIDANVAYDVNPTDSTDRRGNAETILAGNEENTSNLENADFVDYIKPDATYQYADTDVSEDAENGKTFTMTFDITDKFYQEDLSIADLQILISAEDETGEGGDGYDDLTNNPKVGKSLRVLQNIENVVNGETKVIGKRYTLVLTNLEQVQKIEGDHYLDYSGAITLIIPKDKVKDSSGNGNDATSITSGIDIPGGAITNIEAIDVVAPIWERTSFTTDIHGRTATINLLGTDKYFFDYEKDGDLASTSDDGYGTLTLDEIKLFVNGIETTGNITISGENRLYEERLVLPEYGDGDVDAGATTENVQYGVEYTITITDFPIDANQVKIQLTEGSLTDKSNNMSRPTEFLVYNTLISAATETEATSLFLGEIAPEGKTAISRQDIEKVVFVNNIEGSTASGVQNVWDVSAQRDNSIIAWYSETSAPYTVYIGSNDDIYGNVDSSYLFSYIGYSTNCTDTEVVEGLNLLHTENVTDMSYMFNNCGYRKLATLNLGAFDTSKVTNMQGMFNNCGNLEMTSLNLGTKFNTSEVINMSSMFQGFAQNSTTMITFNLGNNFNTAKVENMSGMFQDFAYNLQTLSLGTNFNTSEVTDMSNMFNGCGKTAMTTFSLGNNFNTAKVENMSGMFQDFAYNLETLSLGDNFNTSEVTDMSNMFNGCGKTAITTLTLGDNFNTSKVENMSGMFQDFAGNSSEMTTLDLGEKFYTTSANNMTNMFNGCGLAGMTSLDLGPAFTKIPDVNTDFVTNCGESGAVIKAPESIYNDMKHFKLNTASSTTIQYTQGTINPIYKPEWTKVSSTLTIAEADNLEDSTITIEVNGKIDSTVYANAIQTITSTITAGNDESNLFTVKIDGEDAESITQTVEVVTTDKENEVQYKITLSNFKEDVRQIAKNKNFLEWAGNIAIQFAKGTLVDAYGNKNMILIDDIDGNWYDVEIKDATQVGTTDATGNWIDTVDNNANAIANEAMFTDFIKPEFTYEYANTVIGSGPEGDKKVIVVFDVTDKYFASTDLSTDSLANLITVKVDEDVAANTAITKTLTKLQDLTYTVNGDATHKVGERYQLVIEGLESKDGVGYSGPMTLAFPADIVEDKSGNTNVAKTITIGIDEPENHEEHKDPATVDVVNPLWTGPHNINTIDRTNDNDTVSITILGSDKYYASNTLAEDKITVYVDLDGNGTIEDTEIVNTITKTLTEISATDLQTLLETENLDLGDARKEDVKVGYVLTLKDFGDKPENISGITKVVIDAGTITDTSGNVNLPTTIFAGNINWEEANEPLEETDANYPRYPAFRQDIVDFIDPVIKYQYSAVENAENPDIDYGAKTVTVKFTVTDKYLLESTIINSDGTLNTDVVKIYIDVDGTYTDVTDQLTKNITEANITDGKEYTLVVSNLERNPYYDAIDFSGPMQLVFAADAIDDTSGNKNVATTITLDTDNGDNPNDGVIVDVVDPIIKITTDTNPLSYINSSNTIIRDKVNETGTVKIRIVAEDKYLALGTSQFISASNTIKVKVQKPNGTVIDDATKLADPNAVTVSVEEKSSTSTQVEYEITLGNFTTNEGIVSIIIPEDIIKDISGNGNKETEVFVGNSEWTNDGSYTAFKESIVDFTMPTWNYVTSSITRNRAGETGTVTLKVLGYDIYKQDIPTASELESLIEVYVNNVKNNDIQVAVQQITDTTELETLATQTGLDYSGRIITDVVAGYTLTLSNFGTNDGIVKISIPADTMKDTSGNGNKVTDILVGNPTWIETDVEIDNEKPVYTGFRNSIVDFIKPVIKYQYEENVNPILDREHETVQITFTSTDTNYLSLTDLATNMITLEDMKIYIDDMLVYGEGADEATKITADLSHEIIGDGSANGIKYTLTLSSLELNKYLENEIFERHSGVIKIVIAADQVADTSGNKNVETTIIVDNDNGDDESNGVIVDFVNPNIYYRDKYINWDKKYALIALRATDRFYDANTTLTPNDITLYEENADGQYVQINNFDGKIEIRTVANAYGTDFVIRLNDFEEEFKMKISIPAGKIGDTSGNFNDATEIIVTLDNKKPTWNYVSTDTTEFENNGRLSFTVKGVDKFLDITNSSLDVADLKVIKDGEIYLDGTDATDTANITVNYDGMDETEKSKTYTIDITGLTEVGTYSLVFAKDTLVDEFGNTSAATTISFSKSAIAENTGNYTNITYHVTPDMENVHYSYVHELMSVNTTGTNFENTTYRPSTLGELFNNGENPLFAEPMYVPSVDGYTVSKVYAPKSFAGWAEADSNGNPIMNGTEYKKVYGLYDEIPNTVTNLKAIWQDATVVFVSSNGNNSNDGQLSTTPVKDLKTAYSKLNASGTAENNIIVIMDAIEWNSSETLTGNATITSLYAGVDYRTKQNAELKISSNMTVAGDIIFDNIELYASSTDNKLISNYSGDITLGRGITTPSDKYTIGTVVGGNFGTETSTGELGTHTVRVEVGKYENITAGSSLTNGEATTSTKSITHNVVIGNMRDAAVSRNDKLTITGYVAIGENEKSCYPTGVTNTTNAVTENYANVTLYSGTFTSTDTAIYLRSINGQTDGLMNFEMFGGAVTGNIYGGSRISTSSEGTVFNTMNFYGGQVTGNIFGQGLNDTFTGSSEITLQGNFSITGNVFGGSNRTATTTTSVGKGNSTITVNSSSVTVNGNIYGGGNVTEASTGYITGITTITLNSGTVQNIYGSGYNCGNTGETNITIGNGTVNGNIFGGAYQNQARRTSNITVLGGTIDGNIYGGNDNIASQLDDDAFFQDVNIIIGDTDTAKAPTINGIIYGGGKYDKVDVATIQLIECANITSVFGGSEGSGLTITSDIYLNGMTVNEIYGGSNGADDTTATVSISNIHLQSGTVTDVYGGGFIANSTQANVILDGTATVTSIYGGPNTGGKVTTSNVTLKSGTVTNVFGGGNSAEVGTANVTLDGITIDTIYGGSKDAGLTDTSNVTLVSGTVTNVFGGGFNVGATTANINQQGATVTNIYGGSNGGDTGTTNIDILNTTVENVYGGNYLNGTTRYANINIHGTSTITGKLYGGGYKSAIGKAGETGTATINIAGGTINGDINGGSEQGIVYGNTNINVGFDAIGNASLTPGPINIIGTIYGAGSTLTSGEVTVVGDTNITMDNGTTYPITYFTADGKEKSIYGSGNGGGIYSNGTGTDRSTIHLKDFGTADNIYLFKSIEDTGNLYIGNSVIELVGALDGPVTTTEVGHYYTLNTITNALTIYNNTTLYTQRGFNKVGGFYSYVNQKSTKATVTITDGVATTNVDNKLYTLEGVNLIFANKEVTLANKATLAQADWGEVTGMAYFATYKNTSTGKQYDLSLFKSGTYVEGQYNSYHDINTDGFYTTTEDGAQIIDTTNYANYCDWIINAPTINYDVDLVASTYGQQSVAELLLDYQYASDYTYAPETVYTVNQVSTNALKPGIELVDPTDSSQLPTVSTNANNTFGLTMETTNSGWKQQALTTIYSENNGSFDGDTVYTSDGQSLPGSIKFKIYNSLNITEEKDLGIVTIKLTGQQPVNESGTESYTFNVVIAVNLQTVENELKEQYTPSFTDRTETELSYTTDSRVDLSYLLFDTMETTPYTAGDYRVISTTIPLPAGTKLTMKDYGQGDSLNKVYYYQVATDTDYYATETVNGTTRYLYKLTKFAEMGSTNASYIDSTTYYHSDDKYVLEKYDISIDFINANVDEKVSSDILAKAQETYLELRNSSGNVKYDNGDTTIKYNLVTGQNAVATENISNEGSSYSVVESIEIPITIEASILQQNGVLDTKYYDQIAGIAIQIIGENNIRVKGPELQNYKLTNNNTGDVFASDSNGVIRMPIIEGLGSMSGDYTLSITQANVSPGLYRAQVILYTADDGKYYGTEAELEPLEFNITFISRLSGLLGVKAEDESSRIINKTTGLNLVDGSVTSNAIDLTVGINNPTDETNIRVELYKRDVTYTDLTDETTYTGTSYTLVDIKDYLQGTWTEAVEGSKEYIIFPKKTYSTPVGLETFEFERAIIQGISSGEYKLVFKAYSDDTLVQTFSKTFIVTP